MLSPTNFVRLTEAIRQEILRRQQTAPEDVNALRATMEKAESELALAGRELKRAPADLYELVVADVREVKARRDAAADALAAAVVHQDVSEGDVDHLAEKALAGLDTLRERLANADPQVARSAMQAIVAGIDLEFDHVQHKKMVSSHFRQGTVRFNQGALLNRPTNRKSQHARKRRSGFTLVLARISYLSEFVMNSD